MRHLFVSAALAAFLSVSGPVAGAAPADPAEVTYSASDAAMATAVRAPSGALVGLETYDSPSEAIRAGDMAAFISLAKAGDMDNSDPLAIPHIAVVVDALAAGDLDAARDVLVDVDLALDPAAAFMDAWIYALDGDVDEAVTRHRDLHRNLPGLTADLSLAALLEATGRIEEALAVYESMTPARIEAPEHDFDAKGILFSHVQMVVARRTLLLRLEGRLDEAVEVYQELAAAEPEQAVFYAAAIDSLLTGKGLDNEYLTLDAAFARSVADLSMSLWRQRLIMNAMAGNRLRGLDERRATLDQLALLIDPENDDLRENVVALLASEALFEGAAHVAQSAPDDTSGLQLSAAQSLLFARREDDARLALNSALDLAEEDERLGIVSGAMRIHALMGDETDAVELATQAISLAENPAEAAMTRAVKAEILQQFGRMDESLEFARQARDLDDTHDRRMFLANILGEAGEIEEGLQLIRRERLKRPNDPYMLNTLGYFLISHTDDLVEGYKVLFRANALAPNNPYIADSLGWAYFKLGHMDSAERMIEIARRALEPNLHWELEHHIGDIYWYQGREDEAREAWTTALEEFPPYQTAEELRDKLENGLTEPMPERVPLPRVSLDDAETTQRKT